METFFEKWIFRMPKTENTHLQIEICSFLFSSIIKIKPHYGDPISKKLIPKEYKEKYGITNLFRVELPNFWRMIYSLTEGGTKIEIIAFILDIMDHKLYNKKFGYKF